MSETKLVINGLIALSKHFSNSKDCKSQADAINSLIALYSPQKQSSAKSSKLFQFSKSFISTNIALFLQFQDILNLSATCKLMHTLIQSNKFIKLYLSEASKCKVTISYNIFQTHPKKKKSHKFNELFIDAESNVKAEQIPLFRQGIEYYRTQANQLQCKNEIEINNIHSLESSIKEVTKENEELNKNLNAVLEELYTETERHKVARNQWLYIKEQLKNEIGIYDGDIKHKQRYKKVLEMRINEYRMQMAELEQSMAIFKMKMEKYHGSIDSLSSSIDTLLAKSSKKAKK